MAYDSPRTAPITLPPIGKPKRKKKKPMSPELRAIAGARLKALWQDPAFRERRKKASTAGLKAKWEDPEYRKKHTERLAKMQAKRVACARIYLAERWSDPEERRKASERAKQMYAEGKLRGNPTLTPESKEKKRRACQRMHDRKRGFKIPLLLRTRYRELVKTKRYSAREAGKILGLI